MKFVAMTIMALIVLAALYFVVLGCIKLVRSLLREDDLDEAAELRAERLALEEENERTEAILRKAREAREQHTTKV